MLNPLPTNEQWAEVHTMFYVCFGEDLNTNKWLELKRLMVAHDWSWARVRETADRFLMAQKWPKWAVADWFGISLGVLYNHAYYRSECHGNTKAGRMYQAYSIEGFVLYHKIDGSKIPFEPVKIVKPEDPVDPLQELKPVADPSDVERIMAETMAKLSE